MLKVLQIVPMLANRESFQDRRCLVPTVTDGGEHKLHCSVAHVELKIVMGKVMEAFCKLCWLKHNRIYHGDSAEDSKTTTLCRS